MNEVYSAIVVFFPCCSAEVQYYITCIRIFEIRRVFNFSRTSLEKAVTLKISFLLRYIQEESYFFLLMFHSPFPFFS